MTHDPNSDYKIVEAWLPAVPRGWVTLLHKGVEWWHGPLEAMQRLATDPEARIEARRSKMHHDRKPV